MIEGIVISAIVVSFAVFLAWFISGFSNAKIQEHPYMKEGMRYAAEQDAMHKAGRSSTYFLPNFEYESYREKIMNLRKTRLKTAKRKALRR